MTRIAFLGCCGGCTSADEMYMGKLTLVMADKDTLVEEWGSIKSGKEEAEHMPKFEWKRKK